MSGFKVGDRVKAWGCSFQGARMHNGDRGTVKEIVSDNISLLMDIGPQIKVFHPKQLRRLKKKQKAEKKARILIVNFLDNDLVEIHKNCPAKGVIGDFAVMQEILPNQLTVTREDLRLSYETILIQAGCIHIPGSAFEHFEKLLGLSEKGGGK